MHQLAASISSIMQRYYAPTPGCRRSERVQARVGEPRSFEAVLGLLLETDARVLPPSVFPVHLASGAPSDRRACNAPRVGASDDALAALPPTTPPIEIASSLPVKSEGADDTTVEEVVMSDADSWATAAAPSSPTPGARSQPDAKLWF